MPTEPGEAVSRRRGLDPFVTVSRAEYDGLRLDAAAWRALRSSPHVAELLDEWLRWHQRRHDGDSSTAISAAEDWQAVASTPTYAELHRRRHTYEHPPLSPEQIKARAAAPWRGGPPWT